jgi:hypothetical protein
VRVSRREALLAGAVALLARPGAAGAQRRDDGDVLVDLIAREERAALAGGDFAEQESEHAAALRTHLDALGRRLPEPATEPAAGRSPQEREEALIRAYRRALLELDEPSILKTAGTILASHAGHHALITKRGGS